MIQDYPIFGVFYLLLIPITAMIVGLIVKVKPTSLSSLKYIFILPIKVIFISIKIYFLSFLRIIRDRKLPFKAKIYYSFKIFVIFTKVLPGVISVLCQIVPLNQKRITIKQTANIINDLIISVFRQFVDKKGTPLKGLI